MISNIFIEIFIKNHHGRSSEKCFHISSGFKKEKKKRKEEQPVMRVVVVASYRLHSPELDDR
jgi:hypothetical protein